MNETKEKTLPEIRAKRAYLLKKDQFFINALKLYTGVEGSYCDEWSKAERQELWEYLLEYYDTSVIRGIKEAYDFWMNTLKRRKTADDGDFDVPL